MTPSIKLVVEWRPLACEHWLWFCYLCVLLPWCIKISKDANNSWHAKIDQLIWRCFCRISCSCDFCGCHFGCSLKEEEGLYWRALDLGWDEDFYECEIFSILSIAHLWTSVILVGKQVIKSISSFIILLLREGLTSSGINNRANFFGEKKVKWSFPQNLKVKSRTRTRSRPQI